MPRKQTRNLSNLNGTVYAPRNAVDHRVVIDGVEHFTVSLEFFGHEAAAWRCRIGRWWGPWRTDRGEAMRDLHDAVRTRMAGRPWTRAQDYEVLPISLGIGSTETPHGKPAGPYGRGGAS